MSVINSISSSTLKELVVSGVALQVTLVAESDLFRLFITYGSTETTLRAKRGHIRTFKNLARAVSYLHRMGIYRVVIDTRNLSSADVFA